MSSRPAADGRPSAADSSPLDRTSAAAPRRRVGQGTVALLAGVAVCVGLYQVVPFVAAPGSKLYRYLCGHPLEYVLVGMFCVGLAHVGLRLLEGRRRQSRLAEIEPRLRRFDDDALADRWDAIACEVAEPIVSARLQSLAALHRRWTGGSVVEYATLFSQRAADAVAGGYAVLNTILWAIPIVGFLGTVMGITLAIASITPEQLEGSLVDVTGNLAIAFDTTALSLGFSLVLGFASLVSRRTEEQTLTSLDQLAEAWMLPAFGEAVTEATPTANADAVAEFAREIAAQRERLTVALGGAVNEAEQAFRDEAAARREESLQRQAEQWNATNDAIAASVERWSRSLDGVLAATGEQIVCGVQRSAGEAQQTLSIAAEQQRQWAEMLDKAGQLETLQRSIDSQLQRSEFAQQLDETLHQLTAAVHLMTTRAKAA